MNNHHEQHHARGNHHERHHGHEHDHHGHHHGHEHHHHDCIMHAAESGRSRGMRRHGHGHGGSDDQFDRHGFGGGRRISSEGLQLIVLILLEQKPRHGYEVIKELETYTHGFYVPSPGMIYPTLTFLEESDQATVSSAGNKKLYTITDTGRAALEANREQAQMMLERMRGAGEHMQRMQQLYAEENEGTEGDAFREVVHALRAAIHSKRNASDEEKQRVIAVLQQALKQL